MTRTKQVALGGLMAALAVVIMTLGGMVPLATYICPMLASLPLVLLLDELPRGLCVGWYAVVATLGVLLCPDRETAFVFVFLGWYPIAKPALDRLPRLLRVPAKLALFAVAVAALYGLLIFVFRLEALVNEAKELGLPLLLGLIPLAILSFLLYDLLLNRLTMLNKGRSKK